MMKMNPFLGCNLMMIDVYTMIGHPKKEKNHFKHHKNKTKRLKNLYLNNSLYYSCMNAVNGTSAKYNHSI